VNRGWSSGAFPALNPSAERAELGPESAPMRKKIVLAVVAAAVAAAAFVVSRPVSYRVERSVLVGALPVVVADQITDLRRWLAWSPRERLDPGAQRNYGGTATGLGSSYYWSSTAGLGRGRMTIVAASPQLVEIELEMEEPRPAVADLEFRMSPEGNGTRLAYVQAGSMGYAERVLRVTSREDDLLGTEIEQGLLWLKAAAEAEGRVDVYRLERSARAEATPDAVLAHLGDLRRWAAWWPRESIDPEMRRTHGGAPSGPGASYYWSGNDQVGQGRLTVISASAERVVVEMETERPRRASVDLEFRLSPDGTGTRIVGVATEQRPVGSTERAPDPDSITASELENALARLVSVAEARLP